MAAQNEPQATAASHRTPRRAAYTRATCLLETALLALSDPVRQSLVRELARASDSARACGSFDVPVAKATLSGHFAVLREAGLLEQRDAGPNRLNRLREPNLTLASPACSASSSVMRAPATPC